MISASAALLFSQLEKAVVSAGQTDGPIILPTFHLHGFFFSLHLHHILFEIKIGLCLCAALIATEIL